MSRGPYKFTQADVARVIRAAKQTGAGDVVVQRDGSIMIRLSPSFTGPEEIEQLDREQEIVL